MKTMWKNKAKLMKEKYVVSGSWVLTLIIINVVNKIMRGVKTQKYEKKCIGR
jgi:hypothetical protein